MSMVGLRWGCGCWASATGSASAPWPCLLRTLTHLPSLRAVRPARGLGNELKCIRTVPGHLLIVVAAYNNVVLASHLQEWTLAGKQEDMAGKQEDNLKSLCMVLLKLVQ